MSTMSTSSLNLDLLTPELLATLGDLEFRAVVNADLRKDASNERLRVDVPDWLTRALREEFAVRRLAALQAMLASVEGQIEMRKNTFELAKARGADLQEATIQYHREVAGSLRFRSALLESLPEAEHHAEAREDRTELLERAIRAHRQAIRNENTQPSAADEALWAMLSE